MLTPTKQRHPFLAALVVMALVGALMESALWQRVEARLFDLLVVNLPNPGQSLPITIVAIDDLSLKQVEQRWPWPRSIHARLIDALVEQGAALIVFDVVFSYATEPGQDAALAASIRHAGNVILAAQSIREQSDWGLLWARHEPLPELQQGARGVGVAHIDFESDMVVRRVPELPDALWRVTYQQLRQLIPGIEPQPEPAPGALISWLGNYPRISASQLLDGSLPARLLDGQLVYIGAVSAAAVELQEGDRHLTPYSSWGHHVTTPGVEIQATLLENAVRGLWLRQLPEIWSWLLVAVVGLSSAWLLPRMGIGRGVLGYLLLTSALWALCIWLYWRYQLWLPVAAPLLVATIAMVLRFGLSLLLERRRAQAIKRMFSLYVPPQVVEQLVANLEQASLSGEMRELSILFSDVAGFTGWSEQLPPTAVARLVNLYLDEMTEVIFAHGGTVDKYIGDAIMAFWNAPVSDPHHARNALAAAIGMQAAMPRLNAKLEAEGLPAIEVRIGIHSGEAVVGNLGASRRFTYTTVGDAVNLAARLEPMNKQFHTYILCSDDTAAGAAGSAPLRPLDRIRVRGRGRPVTVFTVATEEASAERCSRAFEAYLARRWDEAEALLQEQLQQVPEDYNASRLLERIAQLRAAPPPADWDGVA